MKKKYKNARKKKLKELSESLKTMIYFVILGVGLSTYAHSTFSTQEQLKEVKSDYKSDLSEIKELMKDFNDKLYDIHKVHYPYNKGKKSE